MYEYAKYVHRSISFSQGRTGLLQSVCLLDSVEGLYGPEVGDCGEGFALVALESSREVPLDVSRESGGLLDEFCRSEIAPQLAARPIYIGSPSCGWVVGGLDRTLEVVLPEMRAVRGRASCVVEGENVRGGFEFGDCDESDLCGLSVHQ